jgi:REP element-mobilizing transposase RayT
MDWFKTMTTNEYIRGVKQFDWERFDKKLWQRSYYDHIIRDEKSYDNIVNYIIRNPENWDTDKFYKS